MTVARNQWYAVAWDGEVAGQPLARTICDVPMVFYRRLDGTPVALRDACPHRLMPLSLGTREGDSLRCKYHGMRIGADGCVEEMPLASDAPPRGLCAEAFAAIERHRLVWVWMGDAAVADPDLIPDLWPCSTPGWVFDGGYYRISCEYRLLIDNLMDLTHETYVHGDSIGQRELMEVSMDIQVNGNEVVLTRWMPNIEAPPFWRTNLRKAGRVDRWQICHFVAPSNVMIDVGVAPVGSGATVDNHDQGVRGMVINAMTPGLGNEVHYFWGMARSFDVGDRGLTERIKAGQHRIFVEDVEILEAQQVAVDRNPGMKMRTFSIDAGGAHARRIIDRLAALPVSETSK